MKNKKNTLKIIYLDFDDIQNPLLAAGQARATVEVGKRMAAMGHDVSVIASRFPGYKNRKENGITYHHIGLGSSNIKLNNLIYIVSLPFAVRNIKADIIIECFTAPISTLFSPLFTKIPVVVLPSMFNAKEFSKKYHLPLERIEAFGAKFYKYFMAYSDVDSRKMLALHPSIDYRIIPQGVGSEYLTLKKKKAEYILFLGRFDINQKGIDLLLYAYAKIANKISYPLYIAGHGPDEEKIKSLIQKLGLQKKVTMIGALYGDKKMDVLSKAAYVAFPSRHDELSLWALEALGAGLPLVCFDRPEYKWMGDTVALYAKSFDIDEYAQKLVAASNLTLNKKMSEQARKLAQGYDWSVVADKFVAYFQDILQSIKK